MILESLVTTVDTAGTVNLAPMGPVVDDALTSFLLRPFRSTTTYRNLCATRCGVLHVVDDVLLLAQAALDRLPALPPLRPAEQVQGQVLVDCCRWFEFVVVDINDAAERTEIQTRIVHVRHGREFWGFNRAKHAVLEATILATRLHLISEADVRAELVRLRSPIEKTAGNREFVAWELVLNHVEAWYQTQCH